MGDAVVPIFLRCGFKPMEGVQSYFRPATLKKGLSLKSAGHIDDVVQVLRGQGEGEVTGRCIPQMRVQAARYDVKINT